MTEEMVLSEEVYHKLVFDVTEKVLIRIPEVIGNLMRNHAEHNMIVKEFYTQFPEFKSDPLSVQSVVQMLEQENPANNYKDILEKAAPLIRQRMEMVDKVNIENVPERNTLNLNINTNDVVNSLGEI